MNTWIITYCIKCCQDNTKYRLKQALFQIFPANKIKTDKVVVTNFEFEIILFHFLAPTTDNRFMQANGIEDITQINKKRCKGRQCCNFEIVVFYFPQVEAVFA